MASISFTQFSLIPRICRWHLNANTLPCMNLVQIQELRLNKRVIMAVSRDEQADILAQEISDGEEGSVEKKTRRTSKRASARTRKKEPEKLEDFPLFSGGVIEADSRDEQTELLAQEMSDGEASVEKKTRRTRKRASARSKKEVAESSDEESSVSDSVGDVETSASSDSTESVKKPPARTRRKAQSTTETLEEKAVKKVTRPRGRKKKADVDSDSEGEQEGDSFVFSTLDDDNEQELELDIEDGEDISFTYGMTPLVCCFGAAQYSFVPAGRRANRLIDHEAHERMKEALWEPEKFVRASGGTASNVAVALASLGGKVAFMGKIGDDSWGHSLLYFLNTNKVQTRSVRIDDKKVTAISRMKIGRRGGFKITNVKPCAEDCLSPSEVNIDVLKEAQMFYFNTFSLLDRNMRLTTLRTIKTAKKLGNTVFYDVNLPMPLWQSTEETKMFIQKVWNLSNIIEVTKQELEFLCGITPTENFDTKDNDRSKFAHYPPEVVHQLWHDNLKVVFVTNGTSKVHYYTKEHNGFALGMEDMPVTPYTSDMSASGDGIVAGLLRMLSALPDLIDDKEYLEKTVKYAISCGVIDQWIQARTLGYPAKEGMEDVVADPHGIRSITEREWRVHPASKR